MEALHLQELLHVAAQGMLYPVIAVLIILIIYGIALVASLLVEAILERRHFKVKMPELLEAIHAAGREELPQLIEQSGLTKQQKAALTTLAAHLTLPEETRVALAKRLLAEQEEAYTKVVSRTDLVSKIAPMIGLMGTLVPLGPGIVAMGQGQTDVLASSIEVAFDTTVAGLLVAIIGLLISRFRRRWYADYMDALEAIATAILEKTALEEVA